MKLIKFHVKLFRSITDSGSIEVGDRISLVGRNESGKTNLLRALEALNPPGGLTELTFAKDFPRDRLRSDFKPDLTLLETTWQLSDDEAAELGEVFPRADGVTSVTVGRRYAPTRWVRFEGLASLEVPVNDAASTLKGLQSSVSGSNFENKDVVDEAMTGLASAIEGASAEPAAWGSDVLTSATQLKATIQSGGGKLSDRGEELLGEITARATELTTDDYTHKKAREWVIGRLPVLIYLDEYPELEGYQNLPQYLQRKQQNELTEADVNFEKLMKVAGLDAAELHTLLQQDQETRHQLANRAGAVVTTKIRELWKDRKLKVRFDPDGENFNTFISDPTTVYDVEVNLDERSRGFRWFFSFYIAFAADTQGGLAEDAILLLDEPGLFLHALGQRDLLSHFASDFENQIIFTTHSPFMIPRKLDEVRTVTISPEEGSVVSNDPVGDEKTVFPIIHALGMEISQSLFIGEWNLVIEGVTDYWYLSTISDFLRDQGVDYLPADLTLSPAGTSSKVQYMVTLLTSHRLKALVLLDHEPQARGIATNLVKQKLIREGNIIFINEGFADPGETPDADVEDLLDTAVFDRLVRDSFAKELEGRSLSFNNNIPRIATRYEQALAELGIDFFKTRPARLFLREMASDPESLLPDASRERFERLFKVITERYEKVKRQQREPFE